MRRLIHSTGSNSRRIIIATALSAFLSLNVAGATDNAPSIPLSVAQPMTGGIHIQRAIALVEGSELVVKGRVQRNFVTHTLVRHVLIARLVDSTQHVRAEQRMNVTSMALPYRNTTGLNFEFKFAQPLTPGDSFEIALVRP